MIPEVSELEDREAIGGIGRLDQLIRLPQGC
jgi:hypothetical protein